MIKALNRSTSSVPAAALILGIFGLVSRMSGILRTAILAPVFGADVQLDIYNAAFRIPDLIYNVILGGAISAAFIPVFIKYLAKDKDEAWKVARSFFYIAAISLALIIVLAYIFMPFLIRFVVPGFSQDIKEATIQLSRIMLLSPLFLGLSAVFSGILHSFKKFFIYSLAPIFYNLGIIIGALFIVPRIGLTGLAWGVALGAFMHMLIQAPAAIASGFSFKLPEKLLHPAIPKIIKLMVPRALSLGAYQINLWVITAIASTIAAGALTVFTFASQFQYLPVGIIGISFATAVFPSLSGAIADKNYPKYLKEFSRAVRNVLYLSFPASVMFFVFRAQIVRLILGRGQFGWEDTQLTAAALATFSIGIFAYALLPVFSKAFYAKQDTKTPFITNTAGMLVNILLASLLIFVIFPYDGILEFLSRTLKVSGIEGVSVIGLPLAFSIGGITSLVLLLFAFFKAPENRPIYKEILSAFVRISAVSIIAGFASWSTLRFFSYSVGGVIDTAPLLLLQTIIASIIGLGVYLFASYLLKFEEFNIIAIFLKGKIAKARKRMPRDMHVEHHEDTPPAE